MTLITLLLGALSALKDMQNENTREVMVLKKCMEKTLKIGIGSNPERN